MARIKIRNPEPAILTRIRINVKPWIWIRWLMRIRNTGKSKNRTSDPDKKADPKLDLGTPIMQM